MANVGRVSQIIGPAVDVEFAEGKQPRDSSPRFTSPAKASTFRRLLA